MFMKPRIKMLYAPNTCVCDMCLGFASEKKKCSIKGGLNRLVRYRKKSVRHRRQMQNSAVWRSKLNKEQPFAKYWSMSNNSLQCLGCDVRSRSSNLLSLFNDRGL